MFCYGLIVGLVIGSVFGLFISSLCVAASYRPSAGFYITEHIAEDGDKRNEPKQYNGVPHDINWSGDLDEEE